ncbi:MAG: hypothetical protein J0H42_00610 [Rhizobiales bacterium]|nr:hypothetical protein [Hyphomicrobiales bacterium]
MTMRNLIASRSIVAVLVFSPLPAASPVRADPNESAQFCWAFGKYDHTVYYAEAEGREDRQASFASLMEISGLYPQTIECRIEDLKSHRSTRAALMKQWRDSELEIVNTTFLSDLDY